jgi:hypothetical protein
MRAPRSIDLARVAALAGRLLALGALALAAIAVLAGCSPTKKVMVGFTRHPVDGLGRDRYGQYRVHIYWFGSDVDGNVVAYRMRFVSPPPASQDPKWDTLYCALPGAARTRYSRSSPATRR